jgi:nucleoside-diphosphate-sugar epimerase
LNVLLTGSSGFLGNYILKELTDHKVFTIGRNNCDINCDLSNNIPKINVQPELVIHAAGLAHFIPKNRIENDLFEKVNVIGCINLLKGIESCGIPNKFIFISTVAVYGLNFGDKINETCKLDPKDSYGKSKAIAEEIIIDWCKKNKVTCTIFRLPLVIGLPFKGNLKKINSPWLMGLYFIIGSGKSKKSMVLAEDVAKVIEKASQYSGIYNLTDSHHPTLNELYKVIKSSDSDMGIVYIPLLIGKFLGKIGDLFGENFYFNSKTFVKMTQNLTFDDSLARETFDWSPRSVIANFPLG